MKKSLRKLREQVDNIDNNIFRLLAKRLILCQKILTVKTALNFPLVDKKREAEIVKRLTQNTKGAIKTKDVGLLMNLLLKISKGHMKRTIES